MTNGFQKPYPLNFRALTTDSQPVPDGRNWILLEPLVYLCKDGRLVRARVGSTTDGISTPQSIWNIIAPIGKYWFSGVLHDSGYRETMEISTDEGVTWNPYLCPEGVYDDMIDEALDSQDASWIEKVTIYKALEIFGHTSFAEDQKLANQPRSLTSGTVS